MAHDVFISYSTDDKAIADAMCKNLESDNIKCWIAPRDILPGMPYGEAIIDGIVASRVMVLIFSSHANNSPHVLRELERGVSKGIYIIPFRIKNLRPSKAIEFFVSAAHWLNAYPTPERKHYKILSDTIAQLLAKGDVNKDKALAGPKNPGEVKKAKANEYELSRKTAENLRSSKQWGASIRECMALFKEGLRELLDDLSESSQDQHVQDKLVSARKGKAQGKTGFEDLDLGQLVMLFTDTEVFEGLRKKLTSNLEKTRKLDWNQIVRWSQTLQKAPDSPDLDENAAVQTDMWAGVFLHDCELIGDVTSVPPAPERVRSLMDCPFCKEPLSHDENFCPQCGVALKVTCPGCHRVLAPDFLICPYCETRVRRRGPTESDDLRKAQDEYQLLSRGVYLDSVCNVREREILDQARLELGLSAHEAERIEHECAPENTLEYRSLVEGVLVDGKIDDDERAFLQRKAKLLDIDDWVTSQIEKAVIAARKARKESPRQARVELKGTST